MPTPPQIATFLHFPLSVARNSKHHKTWQAKSTCQETTQKKKTPNNNQPILTNKIHYRNTKSHEKTM